MIHGTDIFQEIVSYIKKMGMICRFFMVKHATVELKWKWGAFNDWIISPLLFMFISHTWFLTIFPL